MYLVGGLEPFVLSDILGIIMSMDLCFQTGWNHQPVIVADAWVLENGKGSMLSYHIMVLRYSCDRLTQIMGCSPKRKK